MKSNAWPAALLCLALCGHSFAEDFRTPATRSADEAASAESNVVAVWGGGDMPVEIARALRKTIGGKATVLTADAAPNAAALPEVLAERSMSFTTWASTQSKANAAGRAHLWIDTPLNSESEATLKAVMKTGAAVCGTKDILPLLKIADSPAGNAALASEQLGVRIPRGTLLVFNGRRITVEGKSPVTWVLPPATASDRLPRPTEIVQNAGDVRDLISLRRTVAARVAKAFPSTQPATPRVDRGTLLICGGGDMPDDVWQGFIDAAGGVDAPIVFITTAQPNPFEPDPKGLSRLQTLGAKHVSVFGHQGTLTAAEADRFYRALGDAKGVWLMGGRQWRYLDSYDNTRVPELLRGVLDRGGIIGGSSAGAAIQADVMVRGNPIGNRDVFDEGYLKGFGLLPGSIIDIHVSERGRLDEFRKGVAQFPGYLGLAIDEQTAVSVQGTQLTIAGRNSVWLIRHTNGRPGEVAFTQLKSGQIISTIP